MIHYVIEREVTTQGVRMSRRIELLLVIKQEIAVLPKIKLTLIVGVHVAVRVRYNEPKFNQLNGSIIRGVSRDWSTRIHSVNIVPRPHCTYCHQIGQQINECPFIEDNVKQGFVEHFYNLNSEPRRIRNHGHIELKNLYHKRVKTLDRLKEQTWKDNIIKMKASIVANVVPIFVVHVPSLLYQNNIGVTYARTSNFKMELVRFMPLYYMAMF